MTQPQVLIIGLDCLTPQLLFDEYLADLPTFKKAMDHGSWGKLKSVDPPITVPAWSCMMSGYNPAQLGLYGFRHRTLGTYDDLYFARSDKVRKPRLWEILTEAGHSAGIIGVPQTFPVKKMRGGYMVSGFLAPDTDHIFTWPDPLKERIERGIGAPYIIDVKNFRSDDRDRILSEIELMTTRRFDTLRFLMESKPTDFNMIVEMGSDRIHHAFWRFIDREHRLYEAGNPYENSVRDYYRQLDDEIAKTIALLDDDAHLFIVSDHGARRMHGGFAINDWLIERGYLTLKPGIEGSEVKLKPEMIDYQKTKVWAWGGYYARIFVNVEGREPEGQVPAEGLDGFLEQLKEELEAILGPDGESMGNCAFRPGSTAPDGVANGDYPDLMVYFGDLAWRSIGSLNHPDKFVYHNDTGPDDANHDHHGILIHTRIGDLRRGVEGHGERDVMQLVDVGPTVAAIFGEGVGDDAIGKPMDWVLERG